MTLGRPATVSKFIKDNTILFNNLTNKELVLKFIENPEVRSQMKGGLEGDIEKQKTSLYVTIRRIREFGKTDYEFNGRENQKGELKKKWVRSSKQIQS